MNGAIVQFRVAQGVRLELKLVTTQPQIMRTLFVNLRFSFATRRVAHLTIQVKNELFVFLAVTILLIEHL